MPMSFHHPVNSALPLLSLAPLVHRCTHTHTPTGDGVLDAHELRCYLRDIGVVFSEADFSLFLADVDANSDGVIEYGEFVMGVMNRHTAKMGNGKRADAALV